MDATDVRIALEKNMNLFESESKIGTFAQPSFLFNNGKMFAQKFNKPIEIRIFIDFLVKFIHIALC
jgi:hypothetical protein